uniref:Cation/H+ exchanger transmembrane domain-containing protein n=1 Tax=Ignisphaera aggregans TaxID=334771 RepID=A0A7C5YX13_9CREN
MDSSMLYVIFLGLAFAKLFEFLLSRVKIPSIISWFVAGIVIGPYVFGLIESCPGLELFSRIASIFLMFYIGLSTNYSAILRKAYLSVVAGVSGVVTTFFLCFFVLYITGNSVYESVLIAIILSNTASEVVSSTALTINNLFVYDVAITASVVDDIIAVIAVVIISSLFLNLNWSIYFGYLHLSILAIVFGLGLFLFKHHSRKSYKLFQKESIQALIMVILGLSIAFTIKMNMNELLIAYVTGFILNIMMVRGDILLRTDTIAMDLSDFISKLLYLIFLPLLFIYIALSINIASVNMLTLILLFVASTIGKLIGCSIPIYIKTKNKSSILIGILMMMRGSLENTLLSMLYLYNLIDIKMYSTSVIIPFISTLTALVAVHILRKYFST